MLHVAPQLRRPGEQGSMPLPPVLEEVIARAIRRVLVSRRDDFDHGQFRGYLPPRYPHQMPQFVFLPPQTDITRQWAEVLARDVPELDVVVAETPEDAARELPKADAAFGTLGQDLLKSADRLTWLQAPAIAPPA